MLDCSCRKLASRPIWMADSQGEGDIEESVATPKTSFSTGKKLYLHFDAQIFRSCWAISISRRPCAFGAPPSMKIGFSGPRASACPLW